MLGLVRAVIVLVLVLAAAAFFMGYRLSDFTGEPGSVGTSGRDAGEPIADAARERGAEIGERVGAAAGRAAELLSDGAITAKIKSKIALDDTLEAGGVHVATTDRVVTLSGTVATAALRRRAVQLARETDGVKQVKDELRVGGR